MPVEPTFDYPDNLNANWPLGTDLLSYQDDHSRGIKQTIKTWGGTYSGADIPSQVDADIDAKLNAYDTSTVQPISNKADANETAITTKADIDGAALTNATLDGAAIVTDANYSLLPTPLGDVTPTFPADNGKFIIASANVTISGTPTSGHRIDIFASSGDVTVTGAGGNFNGFGTSGPTLTIAGGFGASIINNGTGWYVMGNGSIA